MRGVFFYLVLAFLNGGVSVVFAEKMTVKVQEIDQIKIQGVTLFSDSLIQMQMEIEAGDPVDTQKINQSKNNLKSLYAQQGYSSIYIQHRFIQTKKKDSAGDELILEFQITEGMPIRIGEIKLISKNLSSPHAQRIWRKREASFTQMLLIHPGEIYNLEKIKESQQRIQEVLGAEEYIGAQVEVTQNVMNSQIGPELKTREQGTDHWIQLEFSIAFGERVQFGFRGNQVFTRSQLNRLVNEQKMMGLGKDYANVIRSRIMELYQNEGYGDAQINFYTTESPSERKITYLIQEGSRIQIDSIQWEGYATFSPAVLKEKFLLKASPLLRQGYYIEKQVQKAAELLIEWMKEQGYLGARIVSIHPFRSLSQKSQSVSRSDDPLLKSEKPGVHLVIYLYEGEQTQVQSIEVSGNTVWNREEILKILRVQAGAPLNLFAFSEGLEVLKKIYQDQGYVEMQILNENGDLSGSEQSENTNSIVQYQSDNQFAHLKIQIQEGLQFKVSEIQVENLVRTLPKVVYREMTLKKEDILKKEMLLESERSLRRLGIFSKVSSRLTNDPRCFEGAQGKGCKIVTFVLQEEPNRGLWTLGPGVRSDLGVRLFNQLSYVNLWGQNHTASFFTSVNRRFQDYHFVEGQIQFAYSWPWFLSRHWTFRPSVTWTRAQNLSFDVDQRLLSLTWEVPLVMGSPLVFQLTYTLEGIKEFNIQSNTTQALISENMILGTLTPKLTLDLRDHSLLPRKGVFSSISFDYSSPALGSGTQSFPIGYYRSWFRSDYYVPLSSEMVWSLSFRMGYEKSTEKRDASHSNLDQGAIPLFKQFTLGGVNSIRGYGENELNVQGSNLNSRVYGSLSYVNYRTQLDLPFSGALKFGVFLDAGNLRLDRFSLGALVYGAGFGLHYQTPVGSVNFDWGFKLNPLPGTDSAATYFSVGVI